MKEIKHDFSNSLGCPVCGDIIFSRARHDFHSCSCGAVSIDGGFSYTRVLWSPDIKDPPKTFELEVDQTPTELYDDWNTQADKFGVIQDESR